MSTEEKRNVRRLRQPVILAFVIGCVIGGAALGITQRLDSVHGAELANCHQIEKLKATVRAAVVANGRTLGKRGSAGFAYYATHASELAQAKAQTAAEAAQFTPTRCR